MRPTFASTTEASGSSGTYLSTRGARVTEAAAGGAEKPLAKKILEPPVPQTRDAEYRLRDQNPLLPRHRHRL